MSIMFHHVREEDGEQTLTVFLPGESPSVIPGDHPHFEEILEELNDSFPDEERIAELADASKTVAKYLNPLSERVAVSNGRVYFDGDEVNSTLTDHILRMLDSGTNEWVPLVRFMEKLASNPVPHSQTRLYGWLKAEGDFTITEDGDFIAYKGVRMIGNIPKSIHSGPAIVDGETMNGHVPNIAGSVIEMARSTVQHDPGVSCSTGLHAGTWEYASGFGQETITVKINPRDVVSVPTDSNGQKVRVCRYEVVSTPDATEQFSEPVVGFKLGD